MIKDCTDMTKLEIYRQLEKCSYLKTKSFETRVSLDKRVTEIEYQLKYAIFSTACSIAYKCCTRPISKHLYSGMFKDPLATKHKIFKKRLNS